MTFDVSTGVIDAARRNVAQLFHDDIEILRVTGSYVDDLGGVVTERTVVGAYKAHFAPLKANSDTTADQTQPNKVTTLDMSVDTDVQVDDFVTHDGVTYRVVEVKGTVHTAIVKSALVVEVAT